MSEATSHPPIPPNCPELKYGFFVAPIEHAGVISLDNPGEWRRIISALARCAWLDLIHTPPRGVSPTQAEENAIAWQEWGRKA